MNWMVIFLAMLFGTVEPEASESQLRREETTVTVQDAPLRGDETVVAVRSLKWEGRATVHAGQRTIHIRVRTRIEAGTIVSESWPVEQGEQAMRRMIIDSTGGWMERDGKRQPMPKEMLEHERQQFEFYSQLQPAIAMGKHMSSGEMPVGGTTSTTFRFDKGYPVEARNEVSSPEPGGSRINQIFLLSDYKTVDGFTWPRRIEILHDDKPYFTLMIEKFEAGAAP